MGDTDWTEAKEKQVTMVELQATKARYLRALKDGIPQDVDWAGLNQETLRAWRIEFGMDDETAKAESEDYLRRNGGIRSTTWGTPRTGE